MEQRTRSTWLIVVVVAVAACLCLAAVGVVAWGITQGEVDWRSLGAEAEERVEQSFEVGEAPELQIDNFAGAVTVRAGPGGAIQVSAVKHVGNRSRLAQIQVVMTERPGGLTIKTSRETFLINAWVDLEITVPAGTRLDAHTGSGNMKVTGLRAEARADSGSGEVTVQDVEGPVRASTGSGKVRVSDVTGSVAAETGSGSVEVSGVTGNVEAHTGSGGIDVDGAEGTARLDTGSGSINYQGVPQGECRFETGSGSIKLGLPADPNIKVDLSTGSGTVDVDFTVEGQVQRREVKGTIGSGADGSIYAHTGSGDVDVTR